MTHEPHDVNTMHLPDDVITEIHHLKRVREALCKAGCDPYAALRQPDHCVRTLLRTAAQDDWRAAYLAALASGASPKHAASLADEAAQIMHAHKISAANAEGDKTP